MLVLYVEMSLAGYVCYMHRDEWFTTAGNSNLAEKRELHYCNGYIKAYS